MEYSRKEFLQVSLKSLVVIGLGNALESFRNDELSWPDKDEIQLRFALASDGHYGQADTEYVYYHYKMLGWLNNEKEKRGLDFAVINGDLVHNDLAFLPEVKAKWDLLSMPYYVTRGNHDHAQPETWEKTWGMPLNHAFESGDSAFLILDTSDEKGAYLCPDLAWTRSQLLKYSSNKFLFVFMHITPVRWTSGGIDCPELIKLFAQQPNLKAIFHGHDHDQDSVKEKKGKYYFFDAHIAGDWGTDYRGYRIVEVLKNGKVLTYQVNAALQFNVNQFKIK